MRNFKRNLVLGLLALAVQGFFLPAQAQTTPQYTLDLSQPNAGFPTDVGTYDAATKTLKLDKDLIINSTYDIGIKVNSSGTIDAPLVLDGNTHSITGYGSATATAGINLSGKSYVTIKGFPSISGFGTGIRIISSTLPLTEYCIIENNTLTGCTTGIEILSTTSTSSKANRYHTIRENTIKTNATGISLRKQSGAAPSMNLVYHNRIEGNTGYGLNISGGSLNTVYNNNFINNAIQASVTGATDNSFYLTSGEGGNHWDNWTSPDANADGFVDNSYDFTTGTDALPWVTANGWVPTSSDTEAPVTMAALGGTGLNGWFTTDVQVELTATDQGGSGFKSTFYSDDGTNWQLYSSASAPVITAEGSTILYYYSIDNAGNTEATKNVTIKIDKTAPTVTVTLSPPANASGWNNTNVAATYTASDALSGVASPNGTFVFDTDGQGQSHTFVVTDLAGNQATAIVENVNIDKTPPTFSTSQTPAANAEGWNNSDVTVGYYDAADALSGLVSPATGSAIISTEGAAQAQSFDIFDVAGNKSTASFSVNLDKTAPTVTVTLSPPANASGWNNTNVTATYTASDALSGVASPNGTFVFDTDGQGQSHTFVVTDLAGNQATAIVENVNIDKTPPTFSTSQTPAANAEGWNNSDVTVGYYDAADALSGLASLATGSAIISTEGAAQVQSFDIFDVAGNKSTASFSVNLDKTAPTVTVTLSPPATSGWNNTDVTATYTASDALSGVASPNGTFVFDTDGQGQSHSLTFADRAGNEGSATASNVNIDKIAPVTTAALTGSLDPGGWYTTNVSVSLSATDGGSGVGSTMYSFDGTTWNPAPVPTITQSVTLHFYSTDNAGNIEATQIINVAINKSYIITASAGANGSISPLGSVVVSDGASQTFTIAADEGYHVADVLVDGVSEGTVATYTFTNVTVAHTISATFAINTYTITAAAGPNGTITPSGTQTVNYGTDQTFTITPNAGYQVADVLVDGVSAGAVTTYTFTSIIANHTISAMFAINTYTIIATAGPDGSISPSGTLSVNYGADQTFAITPNAGDHIADVLVDGVSVGAVASYTFTNVTADHTIAASFAIDQTIPSVTGGGWINSPAGAYPGNPTLTGKAQFGFTAKHEKDSPVLKGELEFQVKKAFKFKATNFESLTGSDANARLTGCGTNNGSGDYGFSMSMIDGKLAGDKIDKLRMKIWDKNNGNALVYDSEIGASETALPTLALGGGSIKIHEAKDEATSSLRLAEATEAAEEVAITVPTEYTLYNAYPNPFNPSTTIKFDLPEASVVRLAVYDMLGREVAVLVDGERIAGQHTVIFDAGRLASGMYIYRLQTGGFTQTNKLLLTK